MTPRPCYPTDIPRGARLVREGVIVQDINVRTVEGKLVIEILGDDDCTRLYAMSEVLEIDEDTPQRAARIGRGEALARLLGNDDSL